MQYSVNVNAGSLFSAKETQIQYIFCNGILTVHPPLYYETVPPHPTIYPSPTREFPPIAPLSFLMQSGHSFVSLFSSLASLVQMILFLILILHRPSSSYSRDVVTPNPEGGGGHTYCKVRTEYIFCWKRG